MTKDAGVGVRALKTVEPKGRKTSWMLNRMKAFMVGMGAGS